MQVTLWWLQVWAHCGRGCLSRMGTCTKKRMVSVIFNDVLAAAYAGDIVTNAESDCVWDAAYAGGIVRNVESDCEWDAAYAGDVVTTAESDHVWYAVHAGDTSTVADSDIVLGAVSAGDIVTAAETGKLLKVVPERDGHRLELQWAVAPERKAYKVFPCRYLR